jgi:hypothetical protein
VGKITYLYIILLLFSHFYFSTFSDNFPLTFHPIYGRIITFCKTRIKLHITEKKLTGDDHMKQMINFGGLTIKKTLAAFLIIGLLLVLAPFNEVGAAAVEPSIQNQQDDSIVTFTNTENTESLSLAPEATNTDTPQATVAPRAIIDNSSMDITISGSYGVLFGNYTYTSKVGIIQFVNLTMTLQYRENFLHAWEDKKTVPFVYAGGLGLIAQNQASFVAGETGTYRIVMNGNISTSGGGSIITNRASSQIKMEGGVIIARGAEEENSKLPWNQFSQKRF